MAANLIPIVRNFVIENRHVLPCEIVECNGQSGTRKLLKFDFLCWNAGGTDLVVGAPSQNLQWFEFSDCHNHYHLKEFNDYKIFDCRGMERKGQKQAFCLMDVTRINGTGSGTYTCGNQGISAGWADVYGSNLDCQWIDISGLPNGDYVLEARTNAHSVFKESSYGDNVSWVGLRISGNTVTEIPVPCYREDCLRFNYRRVTAKKIGGSWKVIDGNHWMMDFGGKESDAKKAVRIIKRYKMNQICFVGRPSPSREQLMMYFKVNGQAPSGAFPGEDAIPFNPGNVAALKVGNRWKVVEGAMWMLDFGASEANARRAAWLIKRYNFTHQCFVGRPNPPMMYFRT